MKTKKSIKFLVVLVVLLGLAGSAFGYSLAEDLIIYYTMDEGSSMGGYQLNSAVGPASIGSIGDGNEYFKSSDGIDYSAGLIGEALCISNDGTGLDPLDPNSWNTPQPEMGDFIDIEPEAETLLAPYEDIAVSMWIKQTAPLVLKPWMCWAPQTHATAFVFGTHWTYYGMIKVTQDVDNPGVDPDYLSFKIGGKIDDEGLFDTGPGTFAYYRNKEVPITLGAWYHVAYSLGEEEPNGMVEACVYVNGVLLHSEMVNSFTTKQPTRTDMPGLQVGAYNEISMPDYFAQIPDGMLIDDVAIVKGGLVAEEVANIYAAGLQGIPISELLRPTVYHVDGASGDNGNDGLTRETAFETIQFAIDEANDFDTVLVWPGVYNEASTWGIDFWGKAITVTAAAEPPILEVTNYAYAVMFRTGEDSDSVFSNFVVRNCDTAFFAHYSSPTISNVTVVDNDNGVIADTANPNITNSIFWNNANGDLFGDPDPITAQYSWVEEEQADPNLIAYWKLDGDATDSAGTNDGTIYGATPTTGQINDALDFDGSGNYVDVGSTSELKLVTAGSISVWVKPNSLYQNSIINKRGGSNGGNKNENYWLVFGSVNSCAMIIGDGSDYAEAEIPIENFSLDNWYHIVGFWDSANVMIYLNGDLKGIQPNTLSGVITSDSYPLRIGYDSRAGWHFDGTIDDVRIYNRALSAEEIEQMYNAGLAGHSYGIKPGFVDANAGDYHLLSERGRYRATTDEWLLDDVTSPCIDGGDPNIEPENEPMPNGGRVNMGAYGGTESASMSEWAIEADFDYDGSVNTDDVEIFTGDWLEALTFSEEPTGSALQFDGVDDYVEVDDAPSLDGMDALTLMAWVKTAGKTGTLDDNGFVINKYIHGYDQGEDLLENSYDLGVDAAGVVRFQYNPGYAYVIKKSSYTVIDGSWHHIVGVYTGTKGSIYIDGVEVPLSLNQPDPGGPVNNTAEPVLIGCGKSIYYDRTAFFNGTIDEVAIYDRALNVSEIEDIYHCGVVADSNLVGYWDFEERAGQVAADSSGNGNDGQLGSTPDADSSDPVWVESEVPGVTYHVDGEIGDNSNDGLTKDTAFETIQKGVSTAKDCDTVLVWPGVHDGPVYIVEKAITVKSADEPAVIDGGFDDAAAFYSWEGKEASLANFIIKNAFAGVYVYNGQPVLRNLTIVDCYTGIEAEDDAEPNIISCILADNDYDLWNCTAQYSWVEDEQADPNLVSYWKLDGDATDSAGSNDGTIYGATPTTGQINDALAFDGGNDYVSIPDSGVFDFGTGNFSICTWFKTTSNSFDEQMVTLRQNDNNPHIEIYMNGHDLPLGNLGTHILPGEIRINYNEGKVNDGKWHHVAIAVQNGATDGYKLYLDGTEVGIATYSGTLSNWDTITIGARYGGFNHYQGAIDEVAIYDKALSPEEISEIYETGLAGHELEFGQGPGFADSASGDYHLLSERGRYRATTDEWVLDDVTSPCIDGGDPNLEPTDERMPNGGRVNMGAYGGTAQASMSEWLFAGDLNLDGIVNFADFAAFAQLWQETLPWIE